MKLLVALLAAAAAAGTNALHSARALLTMATLYRNLDGFICFFFDLCRTVRCLGCTSVNIKDTKSAAMH